MMMSSPTPEKDDGLLLFSTELAGSMLHHTGTLSSSSESSSGEAPWETRI